MHRAYVEHKAESKRDFIGEGTDARVTRSARARFALFREEDADVLFGNLITVILFFPTGKPAPVGSGGKEYGNYS